MDEIGDEELVGRASCGEPEAMAELYRRYYPTAIKYAMSLARCLPTAEDLVAESFTRIWVRMQSGGHPRTFMAYVVTTIRNLHVDQIRKSRPVDSLDEATGSGLVDPALCVQDHVGLVLDRVTLARAMDHLTPGHRQVLYWTLVEDCDNAEISLRLGSNVGAVAALAWRARRALAKAYQNEVRRESSRA